MIAVERKKHGVKTTTIWLYDQEKDKMPKTDIIEFVQAVSQSRNASYFLSLFTDLTMSVEQINMNIDKQTRYEIRRAEKESAVYKCVGFDELIPDDDLEAFFVVYDEFARSKKLSTVDKGLITALARQKRLLLCSASISGEPLVFHTYVYDTTRSRLLNSVSTYRTENTIKPIIIGMLNRWLHWKDMCYQKDRMILRMDWGGISYDNPEIANITKFKKEFGGQEWMGYSSYACCSLKGMLYEKTLHALKVR